MAKGLDIRRRIKSVKSTRSITKAMQMVAASKMRKAQEQAVRTRNYAEKAFEILGAISERVGEYPHYLLQKKEGDRYLVLLITSGKGLCGSLNANVLRKTLDFTKEKEGVFDFVTVGKKGRDMLFRLKKQVVADFSDLSEKPSFSNIITLTKFLLEEYQKGSYNRIYIIYSDFISVLIQKAVIKRLVPLGKDIAEFLEGIREKKGASMTDLGAYDYLFEPTPHDVLKELLPRFVEMQIFQAVLESQASEHSARMVAMKSATEAAGDLIDDLTLTYNKTRQSGITQEISEIVGAVEALRVKS